MRSARILLLMLSAAVSSCSPSPSSSPPSSAEGPSSRPAALSIETALPDSWPARFGACAAYRPKIEKAVDDFWPMFPFPAAWAAQLYQESRCDPAAISPVGASGLAQFMPRTWVEASAALHLPPGTSPVEEEAIQVGAFYMARQAAVWSSPRPEHERQRLARASYNAGAGNVIKAQKACGGAPLWQGIAPCLASVTGRNAEETKTYVKRIERWWREMAMCEALQAPPAVQEEWGC